MKLKGKLLALLASLAWFSLTYGQTRPELVVQTGHAEGVRAVTFSPDSKLLLSTGTDHSVLLWNLADRQQLRSLRGIATQPNFVGFGARGQSIVVSASDKNHIFDVAQGRELRQWPDEEQVLAATGEILAVKRDSTVILTQAVTGTQLRTLDDSAPVDKCAFNADGSLLAGTGYDGTIRVWDVATGQLKQKLTGGTPSLADLAFSSKGRFVAAAYFDGKALLWDAVKGGAARKIEIALVNNAPNPLSGLAFTPDERSLVATGLLELAVYDVATGRKTRAFNDGTKNYLQGAFEVVLSPDGQTMATIGSAGNADKTIRLWDFASGKVTGQLTGRADSTYTVALNPDGKSLFTGGQGEFIKLWSVTSSELRAVKGLSIFSSTGTAFSPDGKLLASGTSYGDNTILLRDVETGREVRKLAGHGNWIRSLKFSPDGKLLATVALSNDLSIKLWDVASGQLVRTLDGHTYATFNFAFVAGGKTLVSSGSDKGSPFDSTLRFWDVATGKLLRTVKGMGGNDNIAASPDNKLLAVYDDNESVTVILNALTGDKIHTLLETFTTRSLAFSPDSKTLAIGTIFNNITIWNTATGQKTATLEGHTNWVTSLSFSANGKLLLSGSRDGQAKLWDWSRGAEVASLIGMNETDWLVVTPDGLFDGTPAAWSQILWRYNSDTFNVSPLEAFFNEYFYPGLLADLLAGKRPRANADLARKDRRQPQVKISLPPNVPASNITARTVTVRVDVTDAPPDATRNTGSGASDVRLFRNGSLVKAWRGDVLKGRKTAILEATLPLTAGVNQITAYAFNRDNVKSQDAALTLTGADSLKQTGQVRLLAIGVNQYDNAAFNLKYAVADANEFAAETKRQQTALKTYQQVDSAILLDKDATKANIMKAVNELAARSQPEDAVIIYFAGHGTAEKGNFYLLPHDLGFTGRRDQITPAALQGILSHSVSDRELELAFEGLNAGQMLLVIDACNSGQALEAEEWRRGPMNSKGLAQLAYEKGMYILTAAQSFQAAQEAAKLGHGYLTYALVEEGLKQGLGDASQDGMIGVREWLNYATARVPQMQVEEMKRTRNIGLGVVFVEGDEKETDVAKRNVQRPRVFFRREVEARPFMVGMKGKQK